MKKIILRKMLITFTVILISATCSGQTIKNGSFESWPSGCPYNVVPDNWTNFSTSLGPDQAGTCAGTVTSYQGSSHMNLVWYSTNGLYEGAIQTLTGLTSGTSYQINFYAINDQGLYSYGDPVILDVYLNNSVIFSTPELTSGGNWTKYSVNFTATATSHNFGFKVQAGSTGTSGSVGIDAVVFDGTEGTNTILNESEYNIYPNPFNNEFIVDIQKQNFKDATFIIQNTLGQTVFVKQNLYPKDKKTINMKELPSGIYFINFTIDGKRAIKKLIKQ